MAGGGVLRAVFRAHSHTLTRAPVACALLPAAMVAVLAVGMQYITIDTDPDLIWVPPGATTAQQKRFFDAAFDPFFRVNQVIVSLDGDATNQDDAQAAQTDVELRPGVRGVLGSAPNGSASAGILVSEYMTAALALQMAIVNGTASDGTTLDDICFKPIAGKGCLVETPLDYFWSLPPLISSLSPSDVQAGIDCRTTAASQPYNVFPCWSPIHTPMLEDVVLGGIDCLHAPVPGFNVSVCGGCGYYARALIITFLTLDTPELSAAAAQWESDVFLPLVQNFSYPGLRASGMAQRSIEDQIEVVDSQNQWVVIISYLAMFSYITLALGKFPHPVHTRASLGLQGILVVGLSVVGAIGIVSWSGWHITMIVNEVVPFLVLALGVDNMFIITKAFDRHWIGPYDGLNAVPDPTAAVFPKGDIPFAIGMALEEVGPSITAAALCEALAFGLGATTDIPALQQFCLVAAVAVVLDYFLQITWFASAVVLDAHRQRAGRLDLLPFIALKRPAWWRRAQEDAAGTPASINAVTADGRGTPASYGDGAAEDNVGSLQESLLPPTGETVQPQKKAYVTGLAAVVHRGQYVRQFFESTYAPWLMWTPIRVLVILVWAGALGASCYGVTTLKLGLEQQLVLPTGSYLTDYFNDQSLLGEAGPPLYIVLQNVNYSDPNSRSSVESMRDKLYTVTRWVEPPISSWLSDFDAWNSPLTASWIKQSPLSGCPVPYDGNYTFALQVAQFLYNLPVSTGCCLEHSYCGAQYASDVKFFWGVPKPAPNASLTHDAVRDGAGAALRLAPQPSQLAVGIDDGGCDMSMGYLAHGEVEDALRLHQSLRGNEPAPLDVRVHVPGHVLARSLSAETRGRLARGIRARFDVTAVPLADAQDEHAALLSALGDVAFIPCHVFTSRLRTQLVSLHNQSDFIGAMQHVQAAVAHTSGDIPTADLSLLGIVPVDDSRGVQINANFSDSTGVYSYSGDNEHTAWLNPAPGGAAFPYSLTFVYYEQYNFIRGVAVDNVLVALGVVYGAAYVVTGSFQVALLTLLVVASIVIDLCGFIALVNPHGSDPYGQGPYGVDINAVSVVNLVMAVGLSVEFCVHVASFFISVREECRGSPVAAAQRALVEMGSSVFTGITLTKLVGVLVLAWAPSHLFRLYYFTMYAGIILAGAFHGLVFLPVLLSLVGWACSPRRAHGGKDDAHAYDPAFAKT